MKPQTTASCSLSGPGCPFTGTNGGVSLRSGGIPESLKFFLEELKFLYAVTLIDTKVLTFDTLVYIV